MARTSARSSAGLAARRGRGKCKPRGASGATTGGCTAAWPVTSQSAGRGSTQRANTRTRNERRGIEAMQGLLLRVSHKRLTVGRGRVRCRWRERADSRGPPGNGRRRGNTRQPCSSGGWSKTAANGQQTQPFGYAGSYDEGPRRAMCNPLPGGLWLLRATTFARFARTSGELDPRQRVHSLLSWLSCAGISRPLPYDSRL